MDENGRRIRFYGQLAFAGIAAYALVSVLWPGRHALDSGVRALVSGLIAIYFGISIVAVGRPLNSQIRYVFAQSVMSTIIVWLSEGRAGLVPMPIVSQAFFCLSRPAAFGVAAFHLAVNMVVAARFRGGDALPYVFTFLSAEVFVVAFSAASMEERRTRLELAEAHEKLAAHVAQAEELATVKERNRLARELHDSLGHSLTVIHVQLQAAESQLEHDPERARAALSTAARLTHEGLEDVRRSVSALRPKSVDDRPLPEAIAELASALSRAGTEARVSISGAVRTLSPPIELTVYRAAQEALTNVRRHANARSVTVDLEYAATGVRLAVEDDGQGRSAAGASGFGLIGLRERARLVGGELEIREAPGFRLVLTVPDAAPGA